MPRTLHHPSAPSARLTDAAGALRLVELAVSRPLRPETLVFLADDAHCGHTCFVVSGTAAADDVLDVASLVLEVAERSPAVHAVLLASVRPAVGVSGPAVPAWRSAGAAPTSPRPTVGVASTPPLRSPTAVPRLPSPTAAVPPWLRSPTAAVPRLPPPTAASERTDLDRGLELLDLFERAEVELLDWFVVEPGATSSLRELTGLPSCWWGEPRARSAPGAGPALRRRQPETGGPQPP